MTLPEDFASVRSRPGARGARARAIAAKHPLQATARRIRRRRIEEVDLASSVLDPRGFFVYLLLDDEATPFYIGQSRNILGRLGTHTARFGRRICGVRLIRCESRADMDATESVLIRQHQPVENIRGVNDGCTLREID
jgi:hypothetical protein